ncbi:hypothetical protein LSH36_37g16024 [Paralvinella palmiformis]|uniref:Uncharacterized protein n=1 Tax=Paralvinella palmiformis TaxID=53620 RepID=A0AAD9K8W0_9ANNE|nr:hypothetical protein LSH36_37g16024 [Paralvinella palmiformis]
MMARQRRQLSTINVIVVVYLIGRRLRHEVTAGCGPGTGGASTLTPAATGHCPLQHDTLAASQCHLLASFTPTSGSRPILSGAKLRPRVTFPDSSRTAFK